MQITLPRPGQPHVLLCADGETSPLAVPPEQVMALLKAHGAILLRGFGTSVATLSEFAAQFCSGTVFNESPDRQLLDAARNIQSVNGGCDPFPLHPELSREPWKPDVCFFACMQPPVAMGATTICDGVALAEALPPPLRAAFAARRLAYVQPAPPAILQHWLGTPTPDAARLAAPPADCPYHFATVGGQPARIFTRPVLHRPMFCDALAWGNFLLFSRYYNNRLGFPVFDNGEPVPDAWLEVVRETGDRLSVAIEWQAGDLLLLDNSRFMHGRTAVLPDDGRLIASQFGYLRDALRNPEEPADPPWRRGNFVPPNPRAVVR
jgi:alpha-ketoglutarate-dependent taurine dioxygenase